MNQIMIVGYTPANDDGRIHYQDYVYSGGGIAPTLTARMYKDPIRIIEDE